MNKTFYNHTSAIKFPTAVYPDRFRTIQQFRSNLEQGYNINNILALQNVPDVKVNNFSSKYITQPTLLSDITQLSALNEDIQTNVTRLSFKLADEEFLYIYNSAGLIDGEPTPDTTNQLQRAVGIKTVVEGVYNNNFYFELEILDKTLLRIKHTTEEGVFILNWDSNTKKFVFLREATCAVYSVEHEELPPGTDPAMFDIELCNGKFSIVGVSKPGEGYKVYDTLNLYINNSLLVPVRVLEINESGGIVRAEIIQTERPDTFRYNLDDKGRLFLFKCFLGETYIVTNVDRSLTALKVDKIEVDTSNTIYIDLNFEIINQVQNNDFIAYRTGALNTLSINSDRSLFDQNGQYLFHTEYNEFDINSNQIKFNFFTLDTNRSEYGFIKRGTNMIAADDTIPTFNYRTYNTLDTGVDQESGNDKLSLTYTFYDKDIAIKNGTTTIFTAPPSIYPFEKLNINDSTFIKNGALSGPAPILSDRVYIKRTQTEQYENGRFLCTWLSASNFEEPGIWVDRYYYPDVISKRDALFGDVSFSPSFNDSVDVLDRIRNSSSGRQRVRDRKFFDKISDAAITPNIIIKYDRLGNQDMEDIIQSSSPIVSGFDSCTTSKPLRITQDDRFLGITENLCKVNTTNNLSLDGTFYSRVSAYKQINSNKAFTISFDAYIDPSRQYGYELLGNNTDMGFGVFQDLTVTPFLHVAIDDTLYIYNTDGIPLNDVTFDRRIREVFKLSALQDYVVVCEDGYVYQVDAKGNKVELVILSELEEEYVSSFMEENYIYFLFENNVVKKLKIQNALNSNTKEQFDEAANMFKVTTEEDIKTFEAYSNEVDVIFNEGILRYNNNTYLYPGCGKIQAWETDDIVFYVVRSGSDSNSKYSVIKHNLKRQPVLFHQISTPITDLAIQFNEDRENIIAIATNNKIIKYTTTGGFIESNNYDTYSTEAGTSDSDVEYPLSGGKILALDYINEYQTGGVQSGDFVIALRDAEGRLRLSPEAEITPESLKDPINDSNGFIFTRITNFNRLNRIYDSDKLNFRLTLKNSLNHRDTTTQIINYDQARVDAGIHTFTFSFDSIQGNITLYVDGLLYENRTLPPGKYDLHDVFGGEILIGSTGFVNDIDLSTYLKQPGYYYINNLNIGNFYIYNNAASKTLITALALRNRKIDELVLSIPHGQRNNKATIERFYKFGYNNSSNKVDIVVSNFDIDDESVLSQIRLNILDEAKSILPAGVEINNIKFSK